jgi:mRNA interferase RelE/StbE
VTTYRLRISRKTLREIDHLPGNVRPRMRRTVAELTREPRPPASRPLESDLTGFWRLRIDDYRIIYTIDEDQVLVSVVRVARRTPRTYVGLDGS